jgi:hypothetical protein
MHYIAYAGFTDDDLAAIFAFLRVQTAPARIVVYGRCTAVEVRS